MAGVLPAFSRRVLSARGGDAESADAAVAWIVPGYDGLSLLRARYERQHFPRHTHDTYVIGVNERGAHATWYRGARHVIPAQTLAIVSPGEVHTGEPLPDRQWHYRALYAPPHVLVGAATTDAGGLGPLPHFRHLTLNDPVLTARFLTLHRESQRATSALAVETALVAFVSRLVHRHASVRPPAPRAAFDSPAIRRVVDYLHDHLADPVSLGDLEQVAGFSRYQLIRMFARSHGLTPYAYLIQLRVERAKMMLSGGSPPAVTAQATGFADQSHLTRAFRRLVGTTPGRFAAAVCARAPVPR